MSGQVPWHPIPGPVRSLCPRGHIVKCSGPELAAVVDDRLRLLAPIVVEDEIPYWHQTLDRLLIDLLEGAIALLVIAHAIGENVVGRATVTVFLEVIECLRRGTVPSSNRTHTADANVLIGPLHK